MAGNTIVDVSRFPKSLWWRHNERHGISNHQPFIQAQIIENIKAPRHWPLCGEFTSNAEIVSIWWRHHVILQLSLILYSKSD